MKKSFEITHENNSDDDNNDNNAKNIGSNVITNQKEEVYLIWGRNLDRMLIPSWSVSDPIF